MAYPMSFAGELEFASQADLAAAVAAFPDDPFIMVKPADLVVAGKRLILDVQAYAAASTWDETIGNLQALCERAASGEIRAQFGAEEEAPWVLTAGPYRPAPVAVPPRPPEPGLRDWRRIELAPGTDFPRFRSEIIRGYSGLAAVANRGDDALWIHADRHSGYPDVALESQADGTVLARRWWPEVKAAPKLARRLTAVLQRMDARWREL